jgi:hypothetical protein
MGAHPITKRKNPLPLREGAGGGVLRRQAEKALVRADARKPLP